MTRCVNEIHAKAIYGRRGRRQRNYDDMTWWDPYVEDITDVDTYLRRKFRQDVADKSTGVGVKAEAMLRDAARRVAANGGKPVVLEAKGADCIAAAHAYAAEPQLFSSVRFTDAPPSWTEMAANPDLRLDSFAAAVWGRSRNTTGQI